jgi:hypothetical protein
MGRIWVGVMANRHANLIGLSRYAWLAKWILSRPQNEKEAITQMAQLLMKMVTPDGLAVVMEADHFCMQWRGVEDIGAKMTNSVMRGAFLRDPALHREFRFLITPNSQGSDARPLSLRQSRAQAPYLGRARYYLRSMLQKRSKVRPDGTAGFCQKRFPPDH